MSEIERAILFVDLAGFTRTTDVHGDRAALEVVDRFLGAVEAARGPEDEIVKTIGDEVMVASPTAAGAVAFLTRLVPVLHDEDDFPDIRAGVHHGPVVARDGDYFGTTVNVAARVTERAAPGEVLGTAPIADAARGAGIGVMSLGVAELRNLREGVEVFRLMLCDSDHDVAVDPICGMRVSRSRAGAMVRDGGVERWFCSTGCLEIFLADQAGGSSGR